MKHQRRCHHQLDVSESLTWQQGLEPDLCRLRYHAKIWIDILCVMPLEVPTQSANANEGAKCFCHVARHDVRLKRALCCLQRDQRRKNQIWPARVAYGIVDPLQHVDDTWAMVLSQFVAQTHTGEKGEDDSPWAAQVRVVTKNLDTLAAALEISDASLICLL